MNPGVDSFSYGPANNHGGNAVESDGAYNIECAFTDGVFEDGVKETKDNFNFASWTGGEMTIVVDMSNPDAMTVTITEGAHEPVVTDYAYMVGNNGGWAAPEGSNYDDWRLADEGQTGEYTGTASTATGASCGWVCGLPRFSSTSSQAANAKPIARAQSI